MQAVLEGTKNGVAKAVLLDAKSMALVEVCDSICGRYFTDDDVIPPNYFLKAEMDMMAAYAPPLLGLRVFRFIRFSELMPSRMSRAWQICTLHF